jgi:YceI-like domain
MKNILNRSLVLALVAFVLSQSALAESCTYELTKDSLGVGWTAFKTSQKVAVNGTFKAVTTTGKTKGKTLAKLVSGLSVSVDPTSSDTTVPARDQTLKDFFFSKLTGAISGKIKSVNETDHTAVLALNFNGKSKDVPLKYEVANDSDFKAMGSIDLLDLSANDAYNSIHGKCADLHKGPDGVSKTWTDVNINLKATITKVCR